jgi:hypothetical protein
MSLVPPLGRAALSTGIPLQREAFKRLSRITPIVMRDMLALGHQLKILDSVVRTVVVAMVNNLRAQQHSTKMLCHDKSMLSHIAPTICHRMI